MLFENMRLRERVIGLAVVLVGVLWMPLPTKGDVRPHALISDGTVLQRDRAVNVWGTADRGEVVTVRFRGRETSSTTDDDGQWCVQVNSQQAGGPFPLTIAGKNTIALNVWVGDVWVCSGQSNMWWPVATRPRSKELIGTENPSIRLFTVPQR